MTKGNNFNTAAVQVALRIRPLTDSDRKQPRFANLADDDVLKSFDKTVKVLPSNKLFTFDHIFGPTSTQEDVFFSIGENLIHKFVEGKFKDRIGVKYRMIKLTNYDRLQYHHTSLCNEAGLGQTSSGKTYTMGTASTESSVSSKDEGIVPRSMALLFDLLYKNNGQSKRPISPAPSVSSSTSTSNKSNRSKSLKIRSGGSSHIPSPNTTYQKSAIHYDEQSSTRYTVKVSFVEIYNEELHDLLNTAPVHELPTITIREDTKGKIYWTGVKEMTIHSADDALYYLEQGTQTRATGATDMNEKSSRSHAIFSVSLKQEKWVPVDTQQKLRSTSALNLRSTTPSPIHNRHASNLNLNLSQAQTQEEGEWLITTSKFHFVDLAGSERLKRTAAEGDRRKEGININAGLLALGNVISALGDPSKKSSHVPYRDSKLTRLLQDSLGGNATTLMIACVSAAEYNLPETLNTLQYANRARNIKNRSERNQMEEWMLTENTEILRAMIKKLKNELQYLKLQNSDNKIQAITSHQDQQTGDDFSTEEESSSLEDLYQDQQRLISDLQRQVEELDREATITRERNHFVEKELQRMQFHEAMLQQQRKQQQFTKEDDNGRKGMEFQHLVEPVIEEYEKSVSKLESQLAMMKAALNHSNMTYEEQQNEISNFDSITTQQEETISKLRLRLNKILEREQTNEAYIQELEAKLALSVKESNKDQEMLTDLRNRILKFKESDENTEQYISDLEQRLTFADNERLRLQGHLEKLEAALISKERKNVDLSKQIIKINADNASTMKSILKELDIVKGKYNELENERMTWKEKQDAFQQKYTTLQNQQQDRSGRKQISLVTSNSIDTLSSEDYTNELPKDVAIISKKAQHRKSLAEETEMATSILSSQFTKSEARPKEEVVQSNQLETILNSSIHDHIDASNELEKVSLQHQETVDQLDLLQTSDIIPKAATTVNRNCVQASQSNSAPPKKELSEVPNGSDLITSNHEPKSDNEILRLQRQLDQCNRTISDKDIKIIQLSKDYEKLQEELLVAYNLKAKLEQFVEDANKLDNVETSDIQSLTYNINSEENEEQLLQLIKVYEKLQGRLKTALLETHSKDSSIEELKDLLVQKDNEIHQLNGQISASNEQSAVLHKRLSESLASLTMMKLSSEELQKRLIMSEQNDVRLKELETENIKNIEKLEKRHTEELNALTKKFETDRSIVQVELQNRLSDVQNLLAVCRVDQEAAVRETPLPEKQFRHVIKASAATEQELIIKLQQLIDNCKQAFEMERNSFQQCISKLEEELKDSRSLQAKALVQHTNEAEELKKKSDKVNKMLEEQAVELSKQVERSEVSLEYVQPGHEKAVQEPSKPNEVAIEELENQISSLESELEASKDINDELIKSHKQRVEEAVAAVRREENEILKNEFNNQLNEQQRRIATLQSELEQSMTVRENLINDYQKYQEKMTVQMNYIRQTSEAQISNLQAELQTIKTLHSKRIPKKSVQVQQQPQNDICDECSQNYYQEWRALIGENERLTNTLDTMRKAYEQHFKMIYHNPERTKYQGDNGVDAAKMALLELQSVFAKSFEDYTIKKNGGAMTLTDGDQQDSRSAVTVSSLNDKDVAIYDVKMACSFNEHATSCNKIFLELNDDPVSNSKSKQLQIAEVTTSGILTVDKDVESKVLKRETTNDDISPTVTLAKSLGLEDKEWFKELLDQLSQFKEDNRVLQALCHEKEQIIRIQQQKMENQELEFESLSVNLQNRRDDIKDTSTAFNEINCMDQRQISTSHNNSSIITAYTDKEELEAYKTQISNLEKHVNQLMEENIEFGSLTDELGKELHEMLSQNERLKELMKIKESELTLHLSNLAEIRALFQGTNMSDKCMIDRIKCLLLEEKDSKGRKLTRNMTIHHKHQYSISPQDEKPSFISEKPFPHRTEIQQQQPDEVRVKELQDLNEKQQRDLIDERKKRERAELAIKKLERQIDELLNKKSSFLCF
ncbi:hypothetical protein BDF20DRAFT_917500 [Mycotypha africana]|uniref:uncharacterized protein n=1 Tax=Mycotypha africana TaxID=64632 RepID=UPI0023014C55|nr:uncharacterized protein BDF20DRAFT_917500 [Mycotypha africana]KAI8967562.1 hypothetical protein BDF20DRAFT_917500 [Mycotypha africana]